MFRSTQEGFAVCARCDTPVIGGPPNLCQTLADQGFDPLWTYTQVQSLLRQKEGRQRVLDVNQKTLKIMNLKQINNSDIIKCYPNYTL